MASFTADGTPIYTVYAGYSDWGSPSGDGNSTVRRNYPRAPLGYDRAFYYVIDGPGGYRDIWAYPKGGGEPESVGTESLLVGVGEGNPQWDYSTSTKLKWGLWALAALAAVYAYKEWA